MLGKIREFVSAQVEREKEIGRLKQEREYRREFGVEIELTRFPDGSAWTETFGGCYQKPMTLLVGGMDYTRPLLREAAGTAQYYGIATVVVTDEPKWWRPYLVDPDLSILINERRAAETILTLAQGRRALRIDSADFDKHMLLIIDPLEKVAQFDLDDLDTLLHLINRNVVVGTTLIAGMDPAKSHPLFGYPAPFYAIKEDRERMAATFRQIPVG